MTSISKSVYIDKLDDIFNKYDNTYHRTIKMEPVDLKSNTYINSSKEINDKDPKFKIGDTVRISKYKNIFTKGHVLNWLKKFLCLKNLNKLCHGHILLLILTEKILLERFTKENWEK